MKKFIVMFVFVISTLSWADNLSDILISLKNDISSIDTNGKIRLGVLEIVPSQDDYRKNNLFGNYFIEKVYSDLLQNNSKIKLFERQKLSAVVEELNFSQSNIVKGEEAINIGKISPIDYLLTGNYTQMDNSVNLTFRLLNVVTGEVVISKNSNMKLSKDLATLFTIDTTSNDTTIINKKVENYTVINNSNKRLIPPCEKEWLPKIDEALNHLSTEDEIDSVVTLVLNVSLDSSCEHIHKRVIQNFISYKVYSKRYEKFLIS